MVKVVTYDCNKRLYVRSKAVFAEDMDTINAVMSADTPQNIKHISDGIEQQDKRQKVDGFIVSLNDLTD